RPLASMRSVIRAALATIALPAGAFLAACDPCAGVAACATAPRVAAQGRIVDVVTGHAVAGARVSLVRRDSTVANTAPSDSTATVTDADGNYQLELGTTSGNFDVVVAAPGAPTYRVRNLALPSSDRHGEGTVLGVWVDKPVFGTSLELYYRTSNQPLSSGTATFTRTGGVTLSGGDTYSATVDGSGRAALLGGVTANGAEDVVGVLKVTLPGALGTSVFPGFHLTPSYVFRPALVRRLAVGPELSWFTQIYDRAFVTGVPGTTVTFKRTGGIPTSAESFTAVTDKDGYFFFPLIPLAAGTLVGDLTVHPPAPYHDYVETAWQIPTFDADGVRYLPGFGVGPHLPWLGTVTCGGKPLPNTDIVILRVGGLLAPPNDLYTTTDMYGQFDMSVFKPTGFGTMILDLRFYPPAGSACIGLVSHALSLPTLDYDTNKRYIANWDLPKP
ncbi:MAG: carboxypeptidase-like regulatory domain-containing protein, partial [Gemmatimonadaceae bacterium]